MQNFLEKARRKSERERRTIALSIAATIVLIIFVVWATSLTSRLGAISPQDEVVEKIEKSQGASVTDSIKRKANLLFGDGSPLKDVDLFSKPIEYEREEPEVKEKDLSSILEKFNATNTASTTVNSTTTESSNSF